MITTEELDRIRSFATTDHGGPWAIDTIQKLLADIRRLRAGYAKLAFGDYRKVAKNDKCPHGAYGFEECGPCLEEFAGRMLIGGSNDPA